MEEKKTQVFLSYASEDYEMVKKIRDALTARGLDVWFDKKNLRTGKWKPKIKNAIMNSQSYIPQL